MKATADLPGAPDANSALAGSALNKSQPTDGTSVIASAVTSMSISTRLVPPASVTLTVTPQSHWSSCIFAQNFNSDSDFHRNWLLHSHLRTDIT